MDSRRHYDSAWYQSQHRGRVFCPRTSPGTVCPSGYMSACSATASGSSGWIQKYSMDSGETAVGCCPRCVLQCILVCQAWSILLIFHRSGYVCAGQTCSSEAFSGASLPVVTCSDGSSQGYSYLTIPATATATGISSSASRVGEFALSSFGAVAPMIEIRW